ncbi:MAG: thermonuclease family protein [Chloroflexota bacterium]
MSLPTVEIAEESGTEFVVEEVAVSADIPDGDRATVDFVIDGDTIEVLLDGELWRVRYIGVDTPERDEPFYEEATELNRRLVGGETVILVKDVSETDRFGRLLRYVYLEDGTFVNAELIRQGVARLVTFPPDVAFQEQFSALQVEARTSGAGLWGKSELGAGVVCDCSGNNYNCADFTKQSEAQACYDFCVSEVGEDIHHLDGGGDGLVCESLP